MTARSVEFVLDSGETLRVPDENLRQIYNALWALDEEHGAISTAALLMDAGRLHPIARKPIELTSVQTAVLRKAVALVRA